MLGFLGRHLRSSSRASLSSSLHDGCCCNSYGYGGCRSISSSSPAAQPLLPQPQPLPRHPFLHPTPGLPPLFRAAPHAAADLSDYEVFRRSLCGGLACRALLVDAAGTLIVPAQPAAQVYAEIGRKYGVQLSESEILRRYRWAYAQPWSRSRLRYENDARPFWQFIVEQSTNCKDPAYLEELYNYYTTAEAWRIADPNAGIIFEALRSAGVKVAVVSNFDTRLRPLMNALHCYDWFDAMAISAEVGAEKPNPAIFSAACDLLGVKTEEAVHVGDDRRNDLWGARDAGCDAWLWGENVTSFAEVAEKIGVEVFLGEAH